MSRVSGLVKAVIARNFTAAASTYRKVNRLQNYVAKSLIERMDMMKLSPDLVLDLGSGPGTTAAMLEKKFRRARIIEADISQAMLCESRRSGRRFFNRRTWLCCDAEMSALRTGSVDIVFSSLMLQWCAEPDRVFQEVERILRPEGLFIFSSFGPDTLRELRNSWLAVDDEPHVNIFIDMHDVGDALIRSGMEHPVLETDFMRVHYDDVRTLMGDLKGLGAQNTDRGRRRSLTGKGRITRMLEEYEKFREAGRLPATYEVVYGHAWKPGKSLSRKLDSHTATYSLEALKQGLNDGRETGAPWRP